MVLLALLFSRLVSAGRTEAEIAFNLRSAAQAQAEADGFLYSVIFGLLDPSDHHLQANGDVHRVRFSGAIGMFSIANLDGRINPNTASFALLNALLKRLGADAVTARSVAQAILDWRSPNVQGASEAPQYLAAGLSYAPAGSPFQSLAELGLVLGMPPELLTKLVPLLSLYNEGNPNLDDADPVVRQALKDVGMAATSGAAHSLTAVAINVVIVGAGGVQAWRRADVQLGTSSSETGFQILTWENRRPSAVAAVP